MKNNFVLQDQLFLFLFGNEFHSFRGICICPLTETVFNLFPLLLCMYLTAHICYCLEGHSCKIYISFIQLDTPIDPYFIC